MSSGNGDQLLGVVLLARHGDRQGFYQDPNSYTPFGTAITPTGTEEELQLGTFLRQRYLNETSPNFIHDISQTRADITQVLVRADAGGEGGVIYNSALALLQGLYPPTPSWNETLANGTVVVGASNGYQFIPVESVEPSNDVSLEGWTSCGPFTTATNAFYASPEFQAKANENADFLDSLKQYLDGRQVSLQNMWNIYDFLNVRYIHDANFVRRFPHPMLAQARNLANWHEYGVFSDPSPGGIRNIAGRTILPSILNGLGDIANSSNPLKILYQAISYKPFISLFNMTGVAQQHPELAGIVDYAATVAFEVRSSSNGPVIRFNFKNGTLESDFTTYPLFGTSDDVPLSTFVDRLSDVAINDTPEWCTVCQNSNDRGCGDLTLAAGQAIDSERLHPVGAGLLGAAMAVACMIILFLFAWFLGFIQCGKKTKRTKRGSSYSESDVVKV
ncbi:hypothetical protein D9756_004844 [Leucocoprinus leucothites]|uniref:Phosphoglycerate mutase-like protein n=1 Tax=Leucocoprinus leucothites TaxID=201217 RepID=A0A8H5LKP6_9AGAR|nr:hypothetical protein D9756_004844 [Leucoagaricus leucothites]